MSKSLVELFPDGDYRFSMRFERGTPEGFFGPTAANAGLLAERRKWLQEAPETYAALLPEAIPLVEEVLEMAQPWGVACGVRSGNPWRDWLVLGGALEPDLVLLRRDAGGSFRMVAGAVCFPSHWSLAEKVGEPMQAIHGVVPGLNAVIGKQIDGFLERLRPGVAWLRSNWGVARHSELNDHPSRSSPRLDEAVRLEEVWLRTEHQALVALPKTGGVLFGIRVVVHPLAEVKAEQAARAGLTRALETMPEEMARYKGLATARQTLLKLLREG